MMLGWHRTWWCALFLAFTLVAQSRAQNGDEELAKAIELKLTAKSLAELGEVVQFCEGALSKGLSQEADTEFCRQLLASTLLQRAEVISQAIFQANRPGPAAARQLAQIRQVAISDLRRAVEQDENLADAQLLLARLQSLPGGDREEALVAANRAVELFEDDPLTKARALVIRAPLQKLPTDQLADFGAAIELAPSDLEARLSRGALLVEQGKFALAIEDLNAVIEVDSSQASAFEARGIARLGLREANQAVDDLNRAIELSPESPLAHFHRARAHLFLGQLNDALADVKVALKSAPDNLAALLLRATIAHNLHQSDEALADLNRILELRPGLPIALRTRADVWAEQGKLGEAISDLEAARVELGNDLNLLVSLGALYLRVGRAEKSVEMYSAALAIDDQVAVIHQARGDALLTLGRTDQARADYEAAIDIAPENAGALNNLAWLLATSPDDQQRNGTRALELANRAGELTEFQQPSILSTLAAAYAETGDFTKAIEWSEKAVSLAEPGSRSSLEKELESYRSGKPWREQPATPPAEPEAPSTPGGSPAETAPPDGTSPSATDPAGSP